MSVPTISTERGGGTTFLTSCSTGICPSSSPSSSARLNFTATVTLPFPPPGSTTLISFITLSPTSITTSITTTTSSNFISTTTATTLSVTPLPNPAATAAIAAQSNLLLQNEALSRANFTSTLVLGSISFILLLVLLILFLIYIRKRIANTDSESPPFTSLAPRLGPPFSPPPQIPLPENMRETSLSMGPQIRAFGGGGGQGGGGSTNQYPSLATIRHDPQAFQFGFPSGSAGSIPGSRDRALASHPLTPPPRPLRPSFSAPTSSPEPPPIIPPFTDIGTRPPRISLFPAIPASTINRSRDSIAGAATRPATGSESVRPGTASDTTFGAPLRRQRSVPMYHRALTEQVVQAREESRNREAVRLGVPVIGVASSQVGQGQLGDEDEDESSEISFGSRDVHIGRSRSHSNSNSPSHEEDERYLHPERTSTSITQPPRSQGQQRFAGGITGGQGSGERGRPLHSTRASSGVFPEGREEEEEEDEDETEERAGNEDEVVGDGGDGGEERKGKDKEEEVPS